MILYHGTCGENGEQILNDRCIKKSGIERIYSGEIETTDNLVYLTDLLFNAIYYGNKTSIITENRAKNKELNQYFYVFKIEVDDTLLLPDFDEIKLVAWKDISDRKKYSYKDSLELCNAVTIDEDIKLEGSEYIKAPINSVVLPGYELIKDIVHVRTEKILPTDNEYITAHKKELLSKIKDNYPWIKID